MAFHVRDPETDALVRRYTAQRGVGVTEAVRLAMIEALETSAPNVHERLNEIRARLKMARRKPAQEKSS